MEDEHALAAGQGGTHPSPQQALSCAIAPASQETLIPLPQDTQHRQIAVTELALHLIKGNSLLSRCEEAAASSYEQIGAIQAAAKLMRASAEVARALAMVTGVEQRTKHVIETVQQDKPKKRELNSAKSAPLCLDAAAPQ
jgi:hypothetical protein